MKDVIVHSLDPITLVGAGEATPDDLHKALTLGPTCVAADRGAEMVVAQNIPLAAVIGDFDSLSAEVLPQIPTSILHRVEEQESTDFEKSLSRIRAPVVIGVGFTGGRIDHQLAAFHTLLRFAHQPCVLISQTEVVFLAPPKIELATRAGEVVSLFPLVALSGQSTGLHWPIEGLSFAPGQQIGTSNVAQGPVCIEMQRPGMLMIVPRRLTRQVVQALGLPTSGRWPALGA